MSTRTRARNNKSRRSLFSDKASKTQQARYSLVSNTASGVRQLTNKATEGDTQNKIAVAPLPHIGSGDVTIETITAGI